jgi:nicotinamide-nucleotide amidase
MPLQPGPDDTELTALAAAALAKLGARGWRVTLAESCTGGWIAKALTDVPGSSSQFEAGFVTYSNQAKQEALGVGAATLSSFGAVSRAAVLEMAAGALARSGAALALAVSGVAGPDGGSAGKPVGLVWFALQSPAGAIALSQQFPGDREAVRRQAVARGLMMIADAASFTMNA